jgi:mannitol operon transcriptional activator
MSSVPLDSRQAAITRALLDESGVTTIDGVAAKLQLTDRVVRYNLPSVEAYLAENGLRLGKRRGVGMWVDGEVSSRTDARARLDSAPGPAVLEATERLSRVLLELLRAAPDALRSESLEGRLEVSRATVRRDVRAAEMWLEQHRLHLRRLPGVGISVRGSEVDVRAALLALVLERVPANVLVAQEPAPSRIATDDDGASRGLGSYLAELDLPTFRDILRAELRDFDDRDPTMLMATISLAILATRVRANRPARLVRGRLRSLMDHPVAVAATRIAAAVQGRVGVSLGLPETAAITESLLGFVELTDSRAVPEAYLVSVIDRLVTTAAHRLHPSLADDALLRENLTEHLRRLQVRLRYGLPVSNPLQHEVQKRYPDVYAIAGEILAELGDLDGTAIPLEEVGFLTMYLAGSLERQRLRHKIQVTVVCPAGMATAWILVSRLLAEFPQVEVMQVVSKTAFERETGEATTDLVVSTVPLDGLTDVPWIVVSPLLHERDVKRLSRLVEPSLQH